MNRGINSGDVLTYDRLDRCARYRRVPHSASDLAAVAIPRTRVLEPQVDHQVTSKAEREQLLLRERLGIVLEVLMDDAFSLSARQARRVEDQETGPHHPPAPGASCSALSGRE